MIKAIIFDFDGVLVDSAHIKTEAFRKLFSRWPEKVEEIVSFHLNNMGISRYVKFRHFYENILGDAYSEGIGLELGRQFTNLVFEEIKKAPFISGAEEFLEEYKNFLLFIASGTPHEELIDIVSYKGIAKYFKGIFGSPVTKRDIIKNIFKKYSLEREQVIFVGDAESDKRAAEDAGIYFVLRITPENSELKTSATYKISDLSQLKAKIGEIEK